jgi:peroxiredoxin
MRSDVEKTGAEFSILYDKGHIISDAYDLTFKPDSITRLMYNTALGAKLKDAHSDESERLPVPATFIIDKNGIIVWRQFDRDYKKRSSLNDILNNIPVRK